MKPFVFKLQPVLDQREREERDKRAALARFERLRVELENRIRGYQESIVRAKRDVHEQSMEPTGDGSMRVDVRSMRLQMNAALQMKGKAQMLVVRLAELNKDLEKARKALAEARARRRAVEILKEKAHEAWKRERDRREARELDDINSLRAAREAMGHETGV